MHCCSILLGALRELRFGDGAINMQNSQNNYVQVDHTSYKCSCGWCPIAKTQWGASAEINGHIVEVHNNFVTQDTKCKIIYLIGALANDQIPEIANDLEDQGFEVFADWHSPGPEADKFWKEFEERRGRSYEEALNGYHAWHVYKFDKYHLDRCHTAILVLPAGRSGHLELGYVIGQGKPGYILLDAEQKRFDVMYRFAKLVTQDMDDIVKDLRIISDPHEDYDSLYHNDYMHSTLGERDAT